MVKYSPPVSMFLWTDHTIVLYIDPYEPKNTIEIEIGETILFLRF